MSVPFGRASEYPICGLCHRDLEFEDCFQCGGEGGFDLFEEDPLAYAEGEWSDCDECGGRGWIAWCRVHGHGAPVARRPVLVVSGERL